MSRKTKLVGVIAAALIAFSAVASAAQAATGPDWKISGSFLGSGATAEYKAELESGTEAKLEVPGLLTLLSKNCSAEGKATGSAAGSSGGHKETVLKCSSISVKGAPVCTVANITTKSIKGTLDWMETTGEANIISFEPESGTEFVTVVITGEECSVAGSYTIKGGTVGALTPVATEVTEGTLSIGGTGSTTTTEHTFAPGTTRTTMTSPSLTFGGRAAKFIANFKVKLKSGNPVGVFGH